MERSATTAEIAVCESHQRRGLYLREWSTSAVDRWHPEYRVTVTFLHPGWAVTDWYGDVRNECLVFDTQAEAEAEMNDRIVTETRDRAGDRLSRDLARLCDCGCFPQSMILGHHPECGIYSAR